MRSAHVTHLLTVELANYGFAKGRTFHDNLMAYYAVDQSLAFDTLKDMPIPDHVVMIRKVDGVTASGVGLGGRKFESESESGIVCLEGLTFPTLELTIRTTPSQVGVDISFLKQGDGAEYSCAMLSYFFEFDLEDDRASNAAKCTYPPTVSYPRKKPGCPFEADKVDFSVPRSSNQTLVLSNGRLCHQLSALLAHMAVVQLVTNPFFANSVAIKELNLLNCSDIVKESLIAWLSFGILLSASKRATAHGGLT